jgi:NADH:ubiquinone oxidoreductase subunit H
LPQQFSEEISMELSGLKFGLEIAATLIGIICIAFIAYIMFLSGKTD